MKISYRIPDSVQAVAALTPIRANMYRPIGTIQELYRTMVLRVVKSFAKLVTVRASPSSGLASAGHGVHRLGSTVPTPSLPLDRRGRLKNGDRPGDFLAALRCRTRTHCGGECRQPGMSDGRCRRHGGLSTGQRTAQGLARARLTGSSAGHGVDRSFSRSRRCQFARSATLFCDSCREPLSGPIGSRWTSLPAGHGVDRSISSGAARRCVTLFSHACGESLGPIDRRPTAGRGFPAGHGVHPLFSSFAP